MRGPTSISIGLPALLLASALGCGGSSSGGTARMSVHLVDGPAVAFQEINLHVLKLEIGGGGGWITLRDQPFSVDLLTLTNGVVATLADGVEIPAGSYHQLRLVLDSGNTVKLKSDGSVHDLAIPSGLQSGLKILVQLDVAAGTFRDVTIDFDAKQSIFLHATGGSVDYILRPVIRAAEGAGSGSISGTLFGVQGESTAPLGGVEVTAQVVDASGRGSIVRSTTTADSGAYTLDLLPLGASYHVVSQPVVPSAQAGMPPAVFAGGASGAIALTTAVPAATYDATFDQAMGTGGVAGNVSPAAAADATDLLEVREPFGGLLLVVRSGPVTPGPSPETYAVGELPVLADPLAYSLSVTRTTSSGTVQGAAQTVKIVDAMTAALDLTVP
jgi:hypothetical protein